MARKQSRQAPETTYRREQYIDGNTVRRIQTAPKRYEEPKKKERKKVSYHTRRNREKAMDMSMGYVLFLTVAAVATMFICVNYLQLQSQITERIKNISELESALSEVKANNDAENNQVLGSMDLQHIKDIAVNELGMVFAAPDQVVLYESRENDYIRQFEDIPEEEASLFKGNTKK